MKRAPQTAAESDDRERMIAAAERLAALLADAGPNITVRPLGVPADDLPDSLRRLTSADDDAVAPAREPPAPSSARAAPPARGAAPRPTAGAARSTDSGSQTSRQQEDPYIPASRSRSRIVERGATVSNSAGAPQPAPLAPPAAPATITLPQQQGRGELYAALQGSRRAFMATGLFSLVINVLMLAGPLFMLQVYDRVLTSGSMPTLVALSIMTFAVYGVIGALELTRSRVVARIGAEVDQRIGDRIFEASLRRSLVGRGTSVPALRELDTLRQFLASQGPLTFFDAPWTPVYLAVIFMLHWSLGLVAAAGAAVLFGLALLSERRSRAPIAAAGKAAAKSLELAETGQRNAESIAAMGMASAYRRRWQEANRDAIAWQIAAADELGGMSALSKALRLLLQSLMLAVGAALAISGLISAGAIVASTIIFGRALAPVEQAIGQWRQFLKARESYDKLEDLLTKEPPPPVKTALPQPRGRLAVTGLRVAAPDTRQLILNNVSFEAHPGQMLAVIGPSASGKSTLARALVGLWPPVSGHVRLDGARIDQWSQEDLGRHIGYLPQSVELFSGTVRENIARFRTDARDADIVAAAEQAHAHDLILGLPKGYDTELGAFATYLSAGQRQRIGLARALFGRPALVVLDEPNSNLDRVGDEALASAVDGMRNRGQTVVLISHRVQAITMADLLLYIDKGQQRAFGPRDEVMRLFHAPQQGRPAGSATETTSTATPPADRRGGGRGDGGGDRRAQDGQRVADRRASKPKAAQQPRPPEGGRR
ncbi:MAG: type I secretion system permease/ATPase [Hyphomicrobiaceae bacterium]